MVKPEIMTLEEVAEYLRISERTVYDWAQKGEIPCGKLGTAWRFKRSDIEAWVDRQLAAENKEQNTNQVFLQGMLTPDQVIFSEATTKKEVLSELIDVVCATKQVKNKNELIEGIFFREELMSTGLGQGIAVPHVRLSSIKDITIAAALVPHGITDYESMDNEPVNVVFMIIARKDQHVEHLKSLGAIAGKLKDDQVRKELLSAQSPQEFYNQLIK